MEGGSDEGGRLVVPALHLGLFCLKLEVVGMRVPPVVVNCCRPSKTVSVKLIREPIERRKLATAASSSCKPRCFEEGAGGNGKLKPF